MKQVTSFAGLVFCLFILLSKSNLAVTSTGGIREALEQAMRETQQEYVLMNVEEGGRGKRASPFQQ